MEVHGDCSMSHDDNDDDDAGNNDVADGDVNSPLVELGNVWLCCWG